VLGRTGGCCLRRCRLLVGGAAFRHAGNSPRQGLPRAKSRPGQGLALPTYKSVAPGDGNCPCHHLPTHKP
jgi:hypothetical protein